jgi:hypothetical protein
MTQGRRLPWRWLLPLLLVAGVWFALRPVCVALTAEQVAAFNSPIETRADRDFYVTVFQQRDGRWFQCKTWLSRQFFF